MPVIKDPSYRPKMLFRNGHINTFYPYFLRKKIHLSYSRNRILTPDEDFLDIDQLKNGNERIAILCHGLEGSSDSQYIMGTAALLSANQWDVIAINHRGCSGVPNNKITMYHSGFTQDLHHIISQVESEYKEIALIGFSLGGNMVLKYVGDRMFPLDARIKAAVAVSVPCDLAASSRQISKWFNYLYEKRFVLSLGEKLRLKNEQFPGQLKIDKLKGAKTLFDIDEFFTGPMHGFKDAKDYYQQSNSLQFLHQIQLPTLIINAVDDPFLPEECYPYSSAKNNEFLFLITPQYGGHVGFTTHGQDHYWEETKLLSFINSPQTFESKEEIMI